MKLATDFIKREFYEGVKKYKKKPVEIDAIQWTGDNLKEIIEFTGRNESSVDWSWNHFEAVVKENGLKIFGLEGSSFKVSIGDMIIKGVEGEFYACKPDIFIKTYST
jgi:hypothetical protein